MEMSTPTPAGWDPFATMFENIVSSIRLFEANGEPLIIPDAGRVSDTVAPPSDYRILVPRDWFRVDLTRERWRGQLKTFVDREAADSRVWLRQGPAGVRGPASAGVSRTPSRYRMAGAARTPRA